MRFKYTVIFFAVLGVLALAMLQVHPLGSQEYLKHFFENVAIPTWLTDLHQWAAIAGIGAFIIALLQFWGRRHDK
jgi:hypothetical protein